MSISERAIALYRNTCGVSQEEYELKLKTELVSEFRRRFSYYESLDITVDSKHLYNWDADDLVWMAYLEVGGWGEAHKWHILVYIDWEYREVNDLAHLGYLLYTRDRPQKSPWC